MSVHAPPPLPLGVLPTLPVRGGELRDRLAWALGPTYTAAAAGWATPFEQRLAECEFFLAFASFVEAAELTDAAGDARSADVAG